MGCRSQSWEERVAAGVVPAGVEQRLIRIIDELSVMSFELFSCELRASIWEL